MICCTFKVVCNRIYFDIEDWYRSNSLNMDKYLKYGHFIGYKRIIC